MNVLRKVIISIMLMALTNVVCNPVQAGNVDEKTARRAGSYFLAAQFGTKAINANSVNLVYTIDNMEQKVPAIYFFAYPEGGYVMVAGSDCMAPIIGYGEGKFDTTMLNPNMMYVLSGYVNAIVGMQNTKSAGSPLIAEEWSKLLEQRLPYFGTQKLMRTLTKSKWSQDYPYNSMCPTVSGQRCVTGCVATAMAQVLYYWQYPLTGKGQLLYFLSNIGNISVDFSQSRYQYNLMGNDMTSETNQDAIDAVGKLNYDCGVSVRMMYSPDGSGAYTEQNLPYALRNFFSYDKNLAVIHREYVPFYNNTETPNHGDTLWADTIKNEIMSKRPVIFCGADPRGSEAGSDGAGHAWVVDGYNTSNGFFRMNWGWGYVNSTCWMNMITSNLSGGGYNFSINHEAYLFVQPPQDTLDAREGGTGISDVENVTLGAAYPNPANSEIHLPYCLNDGNAEMVVYDMQGREVARRALYGSESEVVLDIACYPKGVYVYRVNGMSRKFIVK